MANTIPASVPKPDVGLLLAGQGLDSAPVKVLFEASNWAQAHNGTGTPRILQSFPRRGSSGTAGVLVYTAAADHVVCRWRIPDTRGATSVDCYAFGSSISGGGKVEFRSVIGGAVTGMQNLPATAGLIGPFSLDVDASGGYDEVQIWANATGGTVTCDSVLVSVPPLSSPIAAGIDSIGQVAFDAGEHAVDEPLAADAGETLRADLEANREIPHVYMQWSGIDNVAATEARYMRSIPHSVPAMVWLDTQREGWDIDVHVLAKNTGGADTFVRLHAGMGASPSGYVTASSLEVTIPAGSGEAWHTGTMRLPNRRKYLSRLPSGFDSISIVVWPLMGATGALEEWSRRESMADPELLSTCTQIMAISAMGR